MKRIVIVPPLLLTLAACSFSFGESEENMIANNIREELSKNGMTVSEVEMAMAGNDNMSGFAEVRAADGSAGRLACTASRDASKSGRYFDWRCRPTIDQRALDQMEGTIRDSFAARGQQVREIELTRVDDNRMNGVATVGDGSGREVRADCTATRENENSGRFTWQCAPEGQAPAEGGGKP